MRYLFVFDSVRAFCFCFFRLAAKLIGPKTLRQFFKNCWFFPVYPLNVQTLIIFQTLIIVQTFIIVQTLTVVQTIIIVRTLIFVPTRFLFTFIIVQTLIFVPTLFLFKLLLLFKPLLIHYILT